MGIHDRDWYKEEHRIKQGLDLGDSVTDFLRSKKTQKAHQSDPNNAQYRPKEFRRGSAGAARVAAKESTSITRSSALYWMPAAAALSSAATFFTTLWLLAVEPDLLSEPYLVIVRWAAG